MVNQGKVRKVRYIIEKEVEEVCFFDKDMLENVRLGLEGLCFGISFEKVWD